ncbi:MAG: nitrilase family protein, partial [Cyclobacteriaceae bacterium]|nr:nitrilase family protein [Cyclobacteriaceae bacterium]
IEAWDGLLKARAIENLSYTVAVNRVGKDGNGFEYNGHSSAYSPKGELLFLSEGKEVIKTITLSVNELQSFREKFPAHLDADKFFIE